MKDASILIINGKPVAHAPADEPSTLRTLLQRLIDLSGGTLRIIIAGGPDEPETTTNVMHTVNECLQYGDWDGGVWFFIGDVLDAHNARIFPFILQDQHENNAPFDSYALETYCAAHNLRAPGDMFAD